MTDDKPDPFESAEFYTCNEDQEILTLESWEEAIAEVVEDLNVDEVLVAAIRRNGPITVYAHSRETVTDSFVERQAERALEHIAEDFGENYGERVLNISPDSIYTGALGAAIFASRTVS